MFPNGGVSVAKEIENEIEEVVLRANRPWERTELLAKINEQRHHRPITEDQLREAVWRLYRMGKVELTGDLRLVARKAKADVQTP